MERTYICIDLKSFFASVECVERGLDPMKARLVVADPERGEGTICLAVSPALKAIGVKNRCRVFEIPKYTEYIKAQPRMKKYIDYAAEIYGVYIRFVSPDDIHVYSIDEAFLDVTDYLGKYGKDGRGMAVMLMDEVMRRVGIRAACGIGTNLYLCKTALDITAKRAPDFIGSLDEESYKEKLWEHRPLTDFWQVGAGTARRLSRHGIYDMKGVAYADEGVMYKTFGKDAELLIDHAWGRESTTIADIKAYRPKSRCLSSTQVLMKDYTFEEAATIVREMAEAMCLDMTKKGVKSPLFVLYVGYSHNADVPGTHVSVRLSKPSDSVRVIAPKIAELYFENAERGYGIRRIGITAGDLKDAGSPVQLSLFDAPDENRDAFLQETMLEIRKRYGSNAVFRAADLREEATALERNLQIGGHKSGICK